MDKDRIRKHISQLSEKEAKDILAQLIGSSDEDFLQFLALAGKGTSEDAITIKARKAAGAWERMKDIIDNYDDDDYGWYDYRLDDHVNIDGESLSDMQDSLRRELESIQKVICSSGMLIDEDLRNKIHEGCLGYLSSFYPNIGGDRYSDIFRNTLRGLCRNNEELLQLAEDVQNAEGNEANEFVASIYMECGNNEKALEMQAESCFSASSLMKAINELEAIGRKDKAVSIARDKLLTYIGYNEQEPFTLGKYVLGSFSDDYPGLVEYVRTNTFSKEFLDILFLFFRDKKDYGMTKEIIVRGIKASSYDTFMQWYGRLKDCLTEADKAKESRELAARFRKSNYVKYLMICILEGKQDIVLDAVLFPPDTYPGQETRFFGGSAGELDDNLRLSRHLEDAYPKEIYRYWWNKADTAADRRRKDTYSYREAAYIIKCIRMLAEKHGMMGQYKEDFSAFLETNWRKRLLKEKLREYGLMDT